MSQSDDIREEAREIERIAIAKLRWCEMDVVLNRYKGVPETLASIRSAAESALRGAERLKAMAERASA